MPKGNASASKKIVILVSIQIVIIITSFAVLQFFESQKLFLGNEVNVAGKNRFLTSNVISQLERYEIGQITSADVISSLSDYEKNLLFLKNGGDVPVKLIPLESKFDSKWQDIHASFIEFDGKIREYISTSNQSDKTKMVEINSIAIDLIKQNDGLTTDIGLEVQQISSNLILLQIILAVVNIGVHIFMILLILKILKKESERSLKMDRLFTMGEMATRLMHDLKNPLSVIEGTIDIIKIKNPEMSEDMKNEFGRVENSLDRIKNQIGDVMDFVKIREPRFEEHSLKDIIVSSTMTTQIPENIHVIIPKNDVRLWCDKRQIEVLFSNLISNAVEAIENAGGSIIFKIEDNPDSVITQVEDSGPAIPENILTKIFDPLFTTKKKGTGLGLLSCKNIVEAHKGSISATSQPATFTIVLPKTQHKKAL